MRFKILIGIELICWNVNGELIQGKFNSKSLVEGENQSKANNLRKQSEKVTRTIINYEKSQR